MITSIILYFSFKKNCSDIRMNQLLRIKHIFNSPPLFCKNDSRYVWLSPNKHGVTRTCYIHTPFPCIFSVTQEFIINEEQRFLPKYQSFRYQQQTSIWNLIWIGFYFFLWAKDGSDDFLSFLKSSVIYFLNPLFDLEFIF